MDLPERNGRSGNTFCALHRNTMLSDVSKRCIRHQFLSYREPVDKASNDRFVGICPFAYYRMSSAHLTLRMLRINQAAYKRGSALLQDPFLIFQVIFATMKSIFAILALAASALAQGINIGSPTAGQSIVAGSGAEVIVERGVRLFPSFSSASLSNKCMKFTIGLDGNIN